VTHTDLLLHARSCLGLRLQQLQVVLNLSLNQLNLLLLQLFGEELRPEEAALRLRTTHGQEQAESCQLCHV
jgi:hypothetical protein